MHILFGTKGSHQLGTESERRHLLPIPLRSAHFATGLWWAFGAPHVPAGTSRSFTLRGRIISWWMYRIQQDQEVPSAAVLEAGTLLSPLEQTRKMGNPFICHRHTRPKEKDTHTWECTGCWWRLACRFQLWASLCTHTHIQSDQGDKLRIGIL